MCEQRTSARGGGHHMSSGREDGSRDSRALLLHIIGVHAHPVARCRRATQQRQVQLRERRVPGPCSHSSRQRRVRRPWQHARPHTCKGIARMVLRRCRDDHAELFSRLRQPLMLGHQRRQQRRPCLCHEPRHLCLHINADSGQPGDTASSSAVVSPPRKHSQRLQRCPGLLRQHAATHLARVSCGRS